MILDCPSCNARYLVPAAHFAGGPRLVRCARCSHTWKAELPKEPAAKLAEQLAATIVESPPPESGLAPQPIPPGSNLPVLHKKSAPLWLRMILPAAGGAAFLALAGWFVLDRSDLAKRWPSLEPVYEQMGLHIYHPGEGLSLRDVRSEMRFEDGTTQLVVEGAIFNETPADTLQIPDLLATAVGADGNPIQSWRIEPPAATVGAGQRVPFQTRIRVPKGTVIEVNLNFVEPESNPSNHAP